MAKTYDVLAGGIARKPKKQYDVLDGRLAKQVKKEYIVARNPAWRNLPEGYTQREYIESTGAQYVKTGLNGKTGLSLDMEIAWLTDSKGGKTVVGTRAGDVRFYLLYCSEKGIQSGYGPLGSAATIPEIGKKYRVTSELFAGKQELALDGAVILSGTNATEYDTNLPVFIGCCNVDGTANWFATVRIGLTKLFETGVLACDYVPCTNSDGVAGLYDMVTNTFEGSATDTPFVAGPVVHEVCTFLVYIGQQQGSIGVSPATLSIIGAAGTTKTATITKTGTGAVTATSSNSGVATATVSGNTVTVKLVASGSATITLNLAESDDYSAASCTIVITAKIPSATLENNDWATIKAIGAAGTGANYWKVGDRKAVAINGTVGAMTINSTYYAYILGFNHNSSIEGNGIHFQFGFTAASGGRNFAFCDSHYSGSASESFHMNATNGNSGGWTGSYMYNTICPAFLNALPSELRNAISSCKKYSDNTGGGKNTASYVTYSSSKIWLLAEFEVFGARSAANSAEQNYQKRYAFYANGNSAVKYKNQESTAVGWWLRSARATNSTYFCSVHSSGSTNTSGASFSYGFAPAFKVA